MNVLHIVGSAGYESTGMARVVQGLVEAVPGAHDVWFLGPNGPLAQDFGHTRVLNWTQGAKDPVGALRFGAALRESRFDVIHQHTGSRALRWIARQVSDAALLVHLHGRVDDIRAATALADHVVGVSRRVCESVLYPAWRVAEYESRTGEPVVGCACRLVQGKGLETLGAAAQGLPLEIAGEGPLTPAATLLGWQRDLSPVYRRWHVFAMPSEEEGFGMAALEAMAAGLPVVASDVGGLREVVEDGVTGFLVPPRDVAALRARLQQLVSDRALAERMGRAAQRRVRECFSPERLATEAALAYERALERKRARS